ncbi:SapC family protein [Caldimonas sp. KR1-144]|uniref:SapC family protein n=1 Tax=Caldimonas sp. KR1-144 TaxID=3400911 RepID=UPI003C115B39
MTATTPPPALYKEPALLNREAHRGLRYKPTDDASVARHLNAVLCTIGEFAEAAKEYVIAFVPTSEAKDDKGRPELSPVVLLALRDQDNLFVTPEGRWDARYVPAAVRRLPFGYANTDNGQLSVMIDNAASSLGRDEGDLLIDEKGEATPRLNEIIKFLDQFEADIQRTRGLCRRLVELELLKPVQIDVTLPDGRQFTAGAVNVVDEDKIRALPDAAALELVRNGALGLLHAQLISMSNVQRLTDRLGKRLEN